MPCMASRMWLADMISSVWLLLLLLAGRGRSQVFVVSIRPEGVPKWDIDWKSFTGQILLTEALHCKVRKVKCYPQTHQRPEGKAEPGWPCFVFYPSCSFPQCAVPRGLAITRCFWYYLGQNLWEIYTYSILRMWLWIAGGGWYGDSILLIMLVR